MKKQLSILLLSTAVLLGACSHRTEHTPKECTGATRCSSCDIEVKERVVLERPAHFAFDSYALTMADKTKLDAIADRLEANPNEKIRINGFTDNTGTAAYNMGLSQRRAMAVANYLSDEGVAVNRMQVRGMGMSEPIASNDTAAGRAQNRRTEILFFE